MLSLGLAVALSAGFVTVDGVTVDGSGPYRFLVDTGAQSSTISREAAARIGLRAGYAVIRVTAGSEDVVPAYRAARVTLGPASAEGVEMLEGSLEAVRRAAGPVDGVLGQNFLGRFAWLLDLEWGTLQFDLDGSLAARIGGRRTPVGTADGRMLVPARIGGREFPLVLDSGASHIILFERTRLIQAAPASVASSGKTTGALSGLLPEVRVSDVELADVPAALVKAAGRGEKGLLPANLFRAIYADAPSGFVIFNPRLPDQRPSTTTVVNNRSNW